MDWLKALTFATGITATINLLLAISVISGLVLFENLVVYLLLSCTILIYAIGYMGLKQPAIFSTFGTPDKRGMVTNGEEKQSKYSKSTLTSEQAQKILIRLLHLMDNERIYLQSDLKLKDVAEELLISSNHLSQVINENLNKNFFDFVNSYRVKAAKEMIVDPSKQHLTILTIAFEVGFNSKSSFNSLFKNTAT